MANIDKSATHAYQRSLARAVAKDVAMALYVDESRIDFYGKDNGAYNSIHIDGPNIKVSLRIHAPLAVVPHDAGKSMTIGSTAEMNHLVDTLITQADQAWSTLKRDSIIMRRLDARTLAAQVKAAPSLKLTP